jgi:uncharacterized membrane protein YeaQ/YmgE (transglycosylase-associated protein family)
MEYFGLMITGVVVGWIAGQFMSGKGFGVNGDIFAGVFGAIIGGVISEKSGIMSGTGLMGLLVVGITGALVALYATRIFRIFKKV